MEWTTERLFTPIEQIPAEELEALQHIVAACPWRQMFHIQPNTGLLNDPNGFAWYQGEYHLFYQWFPRGPVHGLKYWYHVKSKDLVHWEDCGIGIRPNHDYDNYGAYSGSGIEHEGNLYLLYTGNHRNKDGVRQPKQALAIMKSDGLIETLPEAVIKDVPQGYTEHFRDPNIWKEGDMFYAVIGAQRVNRTGCVVLYRSCDLLKWEYRGELKTTLNHFGHMWECPNYVELDQKAILIFSPQGIEAEGERYQNIYQSGFIVADTTGFRAFENGHSDFCELDRGFDFYAPQVTQDEQGRTLLIGWMGLPEIAYPTDRNQWAHCLTLPRELKMANGKLLQTPIDELKLLRGERKEFSETIQGIKEAGTGESYEIECVFTDITASQVGLNLRVGEDEKTVIQYDVQAKKIRLDRSQSGVAFALDYGTTREISYEGDRMTWRIFMDVSSVEIFINDGEYVMSSRIFPTNDENRIQLFANHGSCHVELKRYGLKYSRSTFKH